MMSLPLAAWLVVASVGGGTLQGRALDGRTQRPVPGASVTLTVSGHARVTDAAGLFTFGDLDVTGPDTLVIEHLAYEPLRIAIGDRDLGPLDLELLMTPRPFELEGLTASVRGRAREEAAYLAEVGDGWLWQREEFESHTRSARNILAPLRWSGKVSQVRESSDGPTCVVIRLRHGCAQVLINNAFVSPDVLASYAPEDVESYVIFGPLQAPLLYGTGASGGVIVVYLRGR